MRPVRASQQNFYKNNYCGLSGNLHILCCTSLWKTAASLVPPLSGVTDHPGENQYGHNAEDIHVSQARLQGLVYPSLAAG